MQKKFVVKSQGSEQAYSSVENLEPGCKVIVDNGGQFVGTLVNALRGSNEELPMILRTATGDDLKKAAQNEQDAKEILKRAKAICRAHNKEMKVLAAEYSLGKEKLIICFSSESRVDFRDLVKELAGTFKTRIELKQIGTRDETRIVGGLGPCGQCCCCNRYLAEPPQAGIKMAKNQNLSLAPQKINGLCGKIMCCVSYENEHYSQTLKEMPKLNSTVKTPDGKGTVTGHDCLRRRVNVKVQKNDEGGFEIKNYVIEELKFEKAAASEHFKGDDEED